MVSSGRAGIDGGGGNRLPTSYTVMGNITVNGSISINTDRQFGDINDNDLISKGGHTFELQPRRPHTERVARRILSENRKFSGEKTRRLRKSRFFTIRQVSTRKNSANFYLRRDEEALYPKS